MPTFTICVCVVSTATTLMSNAHAVSWVSKEGAHALGNTGRPDEVHIRCSSWLKANVTQAVGGKALGGAIRAAASSGMAPRHCRRAFTKHVFPRLCNPEGPCSSDGLEECVRHGSLTDVHSRWHTTHKQYISLLCIKTRHRA